jgi:hypothetical protein
MRSLLATQLSISDQMSFHGPPLLFNLHTRKITISRQHLISYIIFQKNHRRSFWYYLQNPAAALKLIKRTRPAQTPVRPNFGVAITRNADETAPAKN